MASEAVHDSGDDCVLIDKSSDKNSVHGEAEKLTSSTKLSNTTSKKLKYECQVTVQQNATALRSAEAASVSSSYKLQNPSKRCGCDFGNLVRFRTKFV